MAAVFALVMVPALAAVLFMVGGLGGHLSFSTGFAGTVFVGLTTWLVVELFRLARDWEDEEPTGN